MISLPDLVKEKLQHKLPGKEAHSIMLPKERVLPSHIPNDARESAVMILLFEVDKLWNTLLIRRTSGSQFHSGQISFPGGKKEPQDIDLIQTALRECEEEINVKKKQIEVLGTLSSVYIPPSNFKVLPVLGFVSSVYHLQASEREVAEMIQTPLELLFDPAIKMTQFVKTSSSQGNVELESPTYTLTADTIIWGATAMMIAELEAVMKNLVS
jgi:NUDIX domain.